MKVMIVGSGGREHCLAWKVADSPQVEQVFCAPGNGGMADLGMCVPLYSPPELLAFAQEKRVDLTLVGPEAPLASGIVDIFLKAKQPIVGPDRRAARLESSKSYAKSFMQKYGIPTAFCEVFTDYEPARDYLRSITDFPVVIKADGLAGGKGVVIASDLEEAEIALQSMMVKELFGEAGRKVIIEEHLTGEEATVMLVLDGNNYCFLPSSQDHKKVGEGDVGPNTGGMGAYSPAPVITPSLLARVEKEIVQPFVQGIGEESLFYRGVLYLGLMITPGGDPLVLEFNVRMGDPETQVVLPRVKNDWLEVNLSILEGKLGAIDLAIDDRPMLGVVLSSQGYPGNYEKGKKIFGLENFPNHPEDQVLLFHAGTEKKEDGVYTSGGRVLTVCARGETLREAQQQAYQAVEKIHFDHMYYRRDVGYKALERKEN
ncbi:MAG: phosphoribosylamine---glycine ligase [Candidatus Atribacteria bacterium]|nr:phosphoribosylamine---glycine ligase [Candidatus Atribacteria bacterium]